MRDLLFNCPSCAAGLAFDRTLAGKELSCPSCKGRIAVPVPDASFECPSCNVELFAASSAEGQFECPSCKGEVIIEGDEAPAPPVPERPKLRFKDGPAEGAECIPPPASRRCPRCHAGVGESDVICVGCGTDLRTGRAVSQALGGNGPSKLAERPGTVKVAVNLLCGQILLTPLIQGVDWLTSGKVESGVSVVNAIQAGLMCLVGAGKNWARITLLVLTIIVAPLCPLIMVLQSFSSPASAILTVASMAMGLAATVLLFVPKSTAWFRPDTNNLRGSQRMLAAVVSLLMVGLLVGVFLASSLSRGNLEESAVPVVTDTLKEDLDGTAKCTAVRIGEELTNGVHQATASLDDGSTLAIIVMDREGQVEVYVPDIVQYVVGVKKAAEASGDAARIDQAHKMVVALARTMVRNCLTGLKSENPTQDVAEATESVVGLAGIWNDRADLFHNAGDDGPREALALYERGVAAHERKDDRQAIALYTKATEKDVGFPWAFNNLAWALSTSPEAPAPATKSHGRTRARMPTPKPPVPDGPRAVEMAKASIDIVGVEYWSFAGTLAAAHARCGDFVKAIQWQKKAAAAAPPEQKQGQDEILACFRAGRAWTEAAPVGEQLGSASMPEVDFRMADIGDVVQFLGFEWTKAMPHGRALHFELRAGDAPRALNVTMRAKDVPFGAVLDALAAAGCPWQVEGDAVTVRIGSEPPPANEADAATAEMRQTLASVVVPEVNFRQADAYDVLAVLQRTFRERGPEGRSAYFALVQEGSAMSPKASLPEITMLGKELSLGKVLDMVAKAAGCAWTAQGETVVLRPLDGGQRGAVELLQPSAEDEELARAAYALFGDKKDDQRFAGNADLRLVANAVAKMKARTVFPTIDECGELLAACQRLADKRLDADVRRAVDGSLVLLKYERDMLAKGYQRYGGVFMDAESIAKNRQAAAEWTRSHAASQDSSSSAEVQYEWKPVTRRVPAPLGGPRRVGEPFPQWVTKTEMVRVPVKRESWNSPASQTAPAASGYQNLGHVNPRGATDGGGAATDTQGFRNFGYVDPYPGVSRFSKTVVQSYSTYEAAAEARRRRNSAISGPSDALDEAVINAGNAVAFSAPPPKYDIELNPRTGMWDLYMVRQ